MLAENMLRLELGSQLRHSLERDELTLLYQPMVQMCDGTTAGFEALLRWEHPEHGTVSPNTFIPIAESNGLIIEIGKWVLRKACQQAMRWQAEFGRPIMISVNVSVRQLSSTGFVEAVTETLEETKLQPECLKLEVTESFLMQDPESTIEFFHGYTYSGHPVCAAVALENLRIMQEENIVAHVQNVAAPALKEALGKLGEHPLVGGVNVSGLMASLPLTPHKESRAKFADSGTAGYICREHCFANNLVMRHVGDRMIISPPLIITPEEIKIFAERATKALDATYADLKDKDMLKAAS